MGREQVSLQQLESTERFAELDQATKDIATAVLTGRDIFADLLQKQADYNVKLHARTNAQIVEEHEKTRSELKEIIIQQHGGKQPQRLDIR